MLPFTSGRKIPLGIEDHKKRKETIPSQKHNKLGLKKNDMIKMVPLSVLALGFDTTIGKTRSKQANKQKKQKQSR